MGRERKKIKPVRKVNKPCFFCQGKTEPNYKDIQSLQQLLSPRARILPRTRTGICAKHQRRLAESIKQARHMALIPFVISNQ